MKYLVPVVVGAAVMIAAITTAIAQYNHVSPFSTPYVYGYSFALLSLLAAGAIAIAISKQEQPMPQIVVTRYGEATRGTGINSRGYQVGESGLVIANHSEPAYEIGVYVPFVVFGGFRLHFSNRITHLKKEDGESQISAWINSEKGGGILGNGLFAVMRENDIDRVTVPILYKDIRNRWYKTICTIDRDVVHTRDGLLVRTDFRGRAKKPKS